MLTWDVNRRGRHTGRMTCSWACQSPCAVVFNRGQEVVIVVVVVMGEELHPLRAKVLIVLCQSESVVRQSSRATRRTSAVGDE